MLDEWTSKRIKDEIKSIQKDIINGRYVCGYGMMWLAFLKMELARRYKNGC